MCIDKKRGGMRFRNLYAFNVAMLEKQGWRLLSKPNSSGGRILKSIYYPTEDFMDASLGHYPSFL